MRMPNADRALVERVKLTDYCLNPDHPRGRHKARVFEAALGLTVDDVDDLVTALLDAAQGDGAKPGEADAFGQRYVIESEMAGPTGFGSVRSVWIVRPDEDFPRFVSCYVV